MIKKISLPPKYYFLKDKNFLEKRFSEFYVKPKITNLKISSIKMSGNLKIVGEYKIKEKNKIKKIFAIYRFSGAKLEEFKILKYLFNFEFKEPKFLTPRPLFYFKEVIFYESLEGTPFFAIKPDNLLKILKSKIEDIIIALIQFHKIKPPAKNYNITQDLKKLEIFKSVLRKYFKNESEIGLIEEVFSIVTKKRINLFQNLKKFCFCHNDFTFGNLIYQKGKIGLIDFSESCFSDPLFDLGKFLGQLDYLIYLNRKLEREVFEIEEILKNNYFKNQTLFSEKEFKERICVYRAFADIENSIFILGAEEKQQNKEGSFWFLQRAKQYLETNKAS